jgi:predicted DNA-binding transcriptional regulator AlpA
MTERNTEPKERQRRPVPEPLIYRQRDLLAVLSCSRQQLENMMREEGFPAPISLSVRAKGWLVSEVTDWLGARPRRDLALADA